MKCLCMKRKKQVYAQQIDIISYNTLEQQKSWKDFMKKA